MTHNVIIHIVMIQSSNILGAVSNRASFICVLAVHTAVCLVNGLTGLYNFKTSQTEINFQSDDESY